MVSYKTLTKSIDVVAQRRRDLQLTQAELAKRVGYSNSNFVSMLESGKSKVPLEKAGDIAAAIEVDPKWFVELLMRERYPEIAERLFG